MNIQTIRFYERRGLLRDPARTASGYRNYELLDLQRLVFIKWCQPLGWTATAALLLLLLQIVLGLALRDKALPERRTIRGWHYWVMIGVVLLVAGHLWLNG